MLDFTIVGYMVVGMSILKMVVLLVTHGAFLDSSVAEITSG